MARIRSIKPEFWEHEQLGRCSPLARLTFIGLLSLADDQGRGRGDHEALWGALHRISRPATKALWKRALGELKALKDDRGPLVVFYKVSGATYYCLTGFCRQQYIEKPKESKFPPPPTSGINPLPFGEAMPLDQGSGKGSGIRDQGTGIRDQGSVSAAAPSPPPVPLNTDQEGHGGNGSHAPPRTSKESRDFIEANVKDERTRLRLLELVGLMENKLEITDKTIFLNVRQYWNLRENLNFEATADHADKSYRYALDECIKKGVVAPNYLATVLRNAIGKLRDGVKLG